MAGSILDINGGQGGGTGGFGAGGYTPPQLPPPPPPTPPSGGGGNGAKLSNVGWAILLVVLVVMFGVALAASDEDTSFWGNFFGEIMILVFLAIIIWKMGENEIIFAFRSINQISIVERGNDPIKLIGIPPDGYKIEGLAMVPGVQEYHNPLASFFKLFWIGPPWNKIKKFLLPHERALINVPEGTKADKWIERDDDGVNPPESFLLTNPMHDFTVLGIELVDGFILDVLVQVKLILLLPTVSVYRRSGSQPNEHGIYRVEFYREMGKVIQSTVNDICRVMGYQKDATSSDPFRAIGFQALDKSPLGDFNKKILEGINQTLPDISGYKAELILFPKWDLSSGQQQELARLEKEAQIQARVAELKASSENAANVLLMEKIKELYPDATDVERLQFARDIIKSNNQAKMSNLTVLAEGGANVAVTPPTGGGNKKKGGG